MKRGKTFFYTSYTDDFFRGRDFVRLCRLPEGHDLALLLILLISDTKNQDGVLCDDVAGTLEPLDADIIADLHPSFTPDFVQHALDVFCERGYIQRRDDGLMEFVNYYAFTKTQDAAKQARYRQRKAEQEMQEANSNDVGNVVTNDVSNDGTIVNSQSHSHSHTQIHHFTQNDMSSVMSSVLARLHDAQVDGITADFLEQSELNVDVLNFALDKTLEAKPRNSAAYFKRVIESYKQRGFKTLDDVMQGERVRTATAARGDTPQGSDTYQTRNYTDDDYDDGFFLDLKKVNAEMANEKSEAV